MDFHDIGKVMPFFGLMASNQAGRPYMTRLIEQSLPGVLVAAVGIYVSDARQTEQIMALKSEVTVVRTEIQDMRRDLYAPRSIK